MMEINHYYALGSSKDYVQVCKSTQPPVVKTRRNTVTDIPLTDPRSTLYSFNYQCFIGPMISEGKLALLKPGNSEMKDFLRFYFINTSCSIILYQKVIFV